MPDLDSLSIADWIFIGIAILSAIAAWYGAVISWKNQKRLATRESVSLRAQADHDKLMRMNGTRSLEDEKVRIRVFNEGRPIQIEALFFRPKGLEQIPLEFFGVHSSHVTSESCTLGTHETYVLTLKINSLLKLKSIKCEKYPIRIQLTDGEVIDLNAKGLAKILSELGAFKQALDAGHEVLLPDRYVWSGNEGWNLARFEGPIPAHAKITGKNLQDSVSDEEAAIWKSGRNPHREAVEAAMAKKRDAQHRKS